MELITKVMLLHTIRQDVYKNINELILENFKNGKTNVSIFFSIGHIDIYRDAHKILQENGFICKIYIYTDICNFSITWVD